MAIYHSSTQIVKRSDGKSAVAAAAYRSGDKIHDDRTGIAHDYTKKLGVELTEILSPISLTGANLWIKDRAQLWNGIEAVEKRHDAQLAREVNIAIPVELDRQQRIDLVREYVQSSYVNRGMVADVCYHNFQSNNPHAHIMLTMRELSIDQDGIVKFGKKNRDWNDKDLLITHRREWAEIANQHLERAGFDVRIDHRSNVEREIPTIPQIHLGVHCSGMQDRGIKSDRGDRYDEIEKVNVNIKAQLEKIYQLEAELSNLDAEAIAEAAKQPRSIFTANPQLPEALKLLPGATGERTCQFGEYRTKQFTNPTIYKNDALIAIYEKTTEGWRANLEGGISDALLVEIETDIYNALKRGHITAQINEHLKFCNSEPIVKFLVNETVSLVMSETEDETYHPYHQTTIDPSILEELKDKMVTYAQYQHSQADNNRYLAHLSTLRSKGTDREQIDDITERLEALFAPKPKPEAEPEVKRHILIEIPTNDFEMDFSALVQSQDVLVEIPIDDDFKMDFNKPIDDDFKMDFNEPEDDDNEPEMYRKISRGGFSR